MGNTITRRSFMKGAAAGVAVPLLVPRVGFAQSAEKKLRLAAVGTAGKGGDDLKEVAAGGHVEVVALCDIDETNLNQAGASFPGARKYRDWRELFEKEAKNIDAVTVGTPDHMHAPIAMSAIELGKHVYCEKPLTHEVFEARQLTLAARKAGVVTQMGIQIQSHAEYRNAVQMLRDGAIGKVKEWHSWVNAYDLVAVPALTPGEDPIPPNVAWDFWIGVAPFRPYKTDVYHPRRWRAWRDFGCGPLGDFACHIFDPVFTALGIGAPLNVRATAEGITADTWPVLQVVYYEFPGTRMTAGKTIKATWYDGGKKPPRELAPLPAGQDLPDSGSLLIGESGVMVLPHYANAILLPEEKFKEYHRPELGTVNHYTQWVEACLGHGWTTASFDYAGPLTEAVLLGAVAARMDGKTLEWDSANCTITNPPEANALLRRPYREGWKVEGLS